MKRRKNSGVDSNICYLTAAILYFLATMDSVIRQANREELRRSSSSHLRGRRRNSGRLPEVEWSVSIIDLFLPTNATQTPF